jgi:peptidoglycan biosynthesis protein MviN/MurJ (putative lipid II flippase)
MAFLPLCMLPFGFHNRDAVIGIALAYSLAQYVNVAHAWARLRPALGRKLGGMWVFFARLCVVSGLSGAVMLAGYRLLDLNAPMTRQELLVRTAAVAVAGLVVLGALSAALVPTQLREIKRGRVRV